VQHEIDFGAGDDLAPIAGEDVALEAAPEDNEMSPSSRTSNSQKSGTQRKRSTENEGNGSPAKMRKEDLTPASRTAKGMENLHMEEGFRLVYGFTMLRAMVCAQMAVERHHQDF
jgi:hypothetical protein